MLTLMELVNRYSEENSVYLKDARQIANKLGRSGELANIPQLVEADKHTKHPFHVFFDCFVLFVTGGLAAIIRLVLLLPSFATGVLIILAVSFGSGGGALWGG